MKGEDSTGNIMVMLPNGEQGVMVSQDELGGLVQQPGEVVAEGDNKVYVMEGLEMSNGSNMPAIVTSVNGFNPMQKPKYTESSSMIKIVGIQDKKPQQISVVKVGTDRFLLRSRILTPLFRVSERKPLTRQYSRILSIRYEHPVNRVSLQWPDMSR